MRPAPRALCGLAVTDLRPVCAVNTKLSADWLQRKLWEQLNVRAAPIHGDLSQYQRQKALQQFRDGRVRVLVATDVAARGLDVAMLRQQRIRYVSDVLRPRMLL